MLHGPGVLVGLKYRGFWLISGQSPEDLEIVSRLLEGPENPCVSEVPKGVEDLVSLPVTAADLDPYGPVLHDLTGLSQEEVDSSEDSVVAVPLSSLLVPSLEELLSFGSGLKLGTDHFETAHVEELDGQERGQTRGGLLTSDELSDCGGEEGGELFHVLFLGLGFGFGWGTLISYH